jgi:nickel superoxide dismutase
MKHPLQIIASLLTENIAYAHCDIPCGIYDPHQAQIAAHTILRMTNLLINLPKEDDLSSDHSIARMTNVKEQHADILETELETLKNDYFKENHYEQYSSLRELFNNAQILISKTRQTIDLKSCEDLLNTVLEIAEIFYKSKNVTPFRVKSVFPTEKEIVFYS